MRQLSTFWVVIFLVSVSLQNCAPEPGPAVGEAATTEADVEAVKRVREQAVAAINAGDVDALVALATDDIVWMPQDKATSIGKEAFRLYWAGLLEQFVFDRTLSHDEVIVAGDWAIHRSTLEGTMTPKFGGEPMSHSAKAIDILRRQPDGSWRHARIIFNGNSPDVVAHPNL